MFLGRMLISIELFPFCQIIYLSLHFELEILNYTSIFKQNYILKPSVEQFDSCYQMATWYRKNDIASVLDVQFIWN